MRARASSRLCRSPIFTASFAARPAAPAQLFWKDPAMLARIRKAREEREGGFTLIELLVVMIIIGILATIAIPVFLNQRKKAQDSAAKADVSTIGKELATYFVDNTGVPVITNNTTTAPCSTGRYCLTDNAATPYAADLGKVSANVTLLPALVANNAAVNSSHWCVNVQNLQ